MERSVAVPDPMITRALLVRLDNAGDVILLGPAVASLRAAWPGAELTLLTSPAGAQAAMLLAGIDHVREHSASWQQLRQGAIEPAEERALIEELRGGGFDAAVIFTSFSQSPIAPAYACYLAGIPIRAAYAPEVFSGEVITHAADPAAAPEHQAERNLHLLRALRIEVSERDLRVELSAEARASAEELLRSVGIEAGEAFIVLAPGASAPARRYPATRFAQAARELARRHGLRVLVAGSARERDLAATVADDEDEQAVISVAGRTTVAEMAAVIERSALVIANNSLALHLADALRVPVVATYAGTDPPAYWRPRASEHRLLTVPVPCAPCFHIECPYGLECLEFGAADVADAATALLARSAVAPG